MVKSSHTESLKAADTPSQPSMTSIYYNPSDSQVILAEEWLRFGAIQQSLSNLSFGGSAQVAINTRDNLLRGFLELKLPAEPTSIVNGGISLVENWGYHCIRDIEITPPNGNQTLRYTGLQLFELAMCQTEGRDKLDSILSYSGKRVIKDTTDTNYGAWHNYEQTAIIDLNLLFMTQHTSSAECNKGYDMSIIDAPWQLVVSFNNLDRFCNYAPGADVSGFQNTFKSAKIHLRTSQFTDSSFSLRNTLKQEGSVYPVGFNLIRDGGRSYNSLTRVGAASKVSSTRVSIPLNAIDNADLLAVLVSCRPVDKLFKKADIALDPSYFVKLRDVLIEWNGQVLYRGDGDFHELVSQFTSGKIGGIGFTHSGIAGVDISQTPSVPTRRNILTVDMSRIAFGNCARNIQNTVRYLSSQMTLSFSVVMDTFDDDAAHDFITEYSYVYPALLLTSSSSTSIELQ